MFKIIKNFNWIILSSFLCIFMGIVTFLTFINEGFVTLTDKNLQTLLIIDIFLLLVFFGLIFRNFYRLLEHLDVDISGEIRILNTIIKLSDVTQREKIFNWYIKCIYPDGNIQIKGQVFYDEDKEHEMCFLKHMISAVNVHLDLILKVN